jgi:uncharacterized protein YbaA (DUF1428 family)
MAFYVDGFVLNIPKKNIDAYKKIAKKAARVWMDHGALSYHEAVGDDLKVKMGVPFTKLAKTKPSDTVVFAWIVYKSRKHRDLVNKKVMQDKRIANMDPSMMPFDCSKMTYGGFKTIVDAEKA